MCDWAIQQHFGWVTRGNVAAIWSGGGGTVLDIKLRDAGACLKVSAAGTSVPCDNVEFPSLGNRDTHCLQRMFSSVNTC